MVGKNSVYLYSTGYTFLRTIILFQNLNNSDRFENYIFCSGLNWWKYLDYFFRSELKHVKGYVVFKNSFRACLSKNVWRPQS